MKKLLRKVALHGLKHQELLKNRWKETDLTEKEADLIIARIENILTQLPEAIRHILKKKGSKTICVQGLLVNYGRD